MDLLEKFEKFVVHHFLFNREDRILLAVSGGVDSVVMLDLFVRLRDKWSLELAIAHVNHGLRGKEADQDENFVRVLSRTYGFRFLSLKFDAKKFANNHKQSIEDGARKVRFEFFQTIIKRIGYDYVALGHHANDQAETIIMNLIRGSGLRGMGGIRPKRSHILHPLLFAEKPDIESYAMDRHLQYVEDRSNRSRVYRRNRIRWDVIPFMEKAVGFPIVASVCRSAKNFYEADLFLRERADDALKMVVVTASPNEIILDIYEYFHYFKVVQKLIVIRIFEKIFGNTRQPDSYEIDRILNLAEKGKSGSRIDIDSNWSILKGREKLAFQKIQEVFQPVDVGICETIECQDVGLIFKSTIIHDRSKIQYLPDRTIEFLDYDLISLPLLIRIPQKGDWFIPLGMKGKKKLHDFFIDEKIEFFHRSRIPLLVGGYHIMWIVGHRIDDRFKVTDKTRKILKVEVNYLNRNKEIWM